MDAYYIIFTNSLKSSIITSIFGESAWFAAVEFGGYNLWAITIAAVLGSGIGNCLNFGLGYYLGKKRGDWFVFGDKLYQFVGRINRYFIFLLLFPFSSVPIIGIFWSIFVLSTGFFSSKPWKGILLIPIGRVLFYLYYLHAEGVL